MDVPLQPLRIPTGWLVSYNDGLYEIDPLPTAIPEQESRLLLFKEDMLQLNHPRRDRLLDVGWYPEGDIEVGQYHLVVYERDFQGRLLHEFSTRDRAALVAEIERLLSLVAEGGLWVDAIEGGTIDLRVKPARSLSRGPEEGLR